MGYATPNVEMMQNWKNLKYQEKIGDLEKTMKKYNECLRDRRNRRKVRDELNLRELKKEIRKYKGFRIYAKRQGN